MMEIDMRGISITDIKGIKIGHAHDLNAATGCTVVMGEEGMTAGVDVRGGAPGTRETDLLNPVNLVDRVHAVVLAGGSSFGLDAACGVMQYLEERDVGFDVSVTKVPIVCSAVLFDLAIGDHRVRPDRRMGYQACVNAEEGTCGEGSVGAGTGATVGKILGMERCMKSGLGIACVQAGPLQVGAVVAVNCLGDVKDPTTGEWLAGVLNETGTALMNSEEIMIDGFADRKIRFSGNTTIGVVVTNAMITKSQAAKVASMAHNGYARAIRPSHTMLDGDTIFTVATGRVDTDVSVLGLLAARVTAEAVGRGAKKATPLCGLKCCRDLTSPYF